MDGATLAVIRERLHERRGRLAAVQAGGAGRRRIESLLSQVDRALADLDAGTFGICEVCHDTVEERRLERDPLLRHCIDHLSPEQQRALELDLDLSTSIQRKLLPSGRWRHGAWEAGFRYEPQGPVGGDYCDLIPAGDGSFYFVLGDVSGKGVAASMLMTHLHAIFRSLVDFSIPLQEIMERANRLFFESTAGERFCTLVCGRAAAGGQVELANAGHCAPLRLAAGEVRPLPATGPPLGLFTHCSFDVESVRLEAGQSLFLYTDGVTEAANPSGVEYGEPQLRDWASASRRLAPESLIESCLAEIERHRAGAEPLDDLTILVLRRGAVA